MSKTPETEKTASRYLYEVWVTAEGADTQHFPVTKNGFIQAFEHADELCEPEREVDVYVHRWDYSESTFGTFRADQGVAYVGWNDEGEPEDLDTNLYDCDGVFLNKVPKSILAAFDKARIAYLEKLN